MSSLILCILEDQVLFYFLFVSFISSFELRFTLFPFPSVMGNVSKYIFRSSPIPFAFYILQKEPVEACRPVL